MPAKWRSSADELQTLPGIGPSLARDLRALGIWRVAELKRRDPERVYVQLGRLRGVRQDPCVRYAFRCAAYVARTARPKAELLKVELEGSRARGRHLRIGRATRVLGVAIGRRSRVKRPRVVRRTVRSRARQS